MDFVQEASRLAELGFHVFPCADPRIDKADAGKKGKRPLSKNGCNNATLDFDIIESWGNLYPTANIGITCFNCFVIDVDDKDGKNGSSDLQALIDRFGPLPDGPIAKTGSGGYHRFFAKPQEDIVGNTGLVFEGRKTGLDIRVGSQYVVAPPSLHECGRRYEWIKPLGAIEKLPPLPASWIEKVFKKRVESGELKVESGANNSTLHFQLSTFNSKLSTLERAIAYLDKVSPAIQGANGHNTLLWVATRLIHGFGLNSIETESLLTNHYNPRCVPPWDLANSLQYRDFVRKIEQAEIKKPNKEPLWLLNNQPDIEYYPNVDFSGIMNQGKVEVIDEDEEFEQSVADVPPIPDRLLQMPGFVNEVIDFCMKNAPYPIPALAFGGAVALQSFLVGRKVREPGDLRTNLYLLQLANASSGKDYSRKIAKAVIGRIGRGKSVGGRFSSGQGVEDAMFMSPNLLLLSDEFDTILQKVQHGDKHSEEILSTLLTLYTSSDTEYERRFKAGMKQNDIISQPHLTILGIATPTNYYASLNEKMLAGGYMARTIVLDASKRPKGQDANPAEWILQNERITETAQWWDSFNTVGDLSTEYPKPTTVEYAGNAREIMREFRRASEQEYHKAEEKDDVATMSVWGRAAENATRLALVAACSADHTNLRITPNQVKWAVEFMDHQVRRSLHLVSMYAATTDFDAKIKKVLNAIKKWQGTSNGVPMARWRLERALGESPDDFDRVMLAVQRRRLVRFGKVQQDGKGRPKEGFLLCD